VLGVVEPGQWSGSWVDVNVGGSNEGMGLFWKTAKCTISNLTSILTGGPRRVMVALIKPVGYTTNGGWTRIYAVHFKAGSDPTSATTRASEAANLRSTINTTPTTTAGTNFLVCGDTNIYDGTEGAYTGLTASQTNNVGRAYDYVAMSAPWHSNDLNAAAFTQCPCNSCSVTGQSGGGLDDRFDLMLTSASLQDGAGMDYVPGSYTPFGNDGQHFNTDINAGGFNNAVGITVANALHDAADHIPVMITLQLPAKYAVPSQLSFGRAIVGSGPTASLSVSKAAAAPAEVLGYTLAASAGFTAPAGTFHASAGAAANLHALGMDASAPGTLSGSVTLASNDNDTTSKAVLLDGTVVAHAVPSLDSLAVTTAAFVGFGSNLAGGFTDQPVRVYDRGYGPLQSQLRVTGAAITGDPHFSLVGFAPATIGSPGVTWNVHFDDSTAPADSDFDATLTLSTADEAIPGGTAEAPLVLALHAHTLSGTAGIPGRALALRFDPPSPNPAHGGALMAFDLPAPAPVSLGVYDLTGRRIARLADGTLGQGHHSLRWNAQDDAGNPVPAGLYFVRFATPGLTRVSRLAILP